MKDKVHNYGLVSFKRGGNNKINYIKQEDAFFELSVTF